MTIVYTVSHSYLIDELFVVFLPWFGFIALRCIIKLWWICLHYLHPTLPRCQMRSDHQGILLYQIQFLSHTHSSRLRRYWQIKFWLKMPRFHKQHWTLPCYVGAIRTEPRMSQRCVAIFPVSDQWVHRVSLLVDDNEPELLLYLYTRTDLKEGCVPVGR